MPPSSDLPKTLQIEPTNACNFNCEMCLHDSTTKSSDTFLPLENFENLARNVFPALDCLVLFGWGEPLLHPDFIRMLEIARAALKPSANIKVTSNGSLLNNQKIDTILNNNLIDHVNISCDLPAGGKESFPGHHSAMDRVLSNLEYALNHPLRDRVKIGIETVVMRSNIETLPQLVEQFGESGVDSILASHVFPYHVQLESEMLYTLMSEEAYAVFEEIGELAPQVWFGLTERQTSGSTGEIPGISPQQQQILDRARASSIKLNYALFQKLKDRASEFESTRGIFDKARCNANRFSIELDLPPLFGSMEQRACPYIKAHAAVIRSDGTVVPCFKNLYQHSAYFNGRTRAYTPCEFGSIHTTPFSDIWNSAAYLQFRADMQDMNEHIAWCGDCSFSMYYCYFSEEASHDCMLNDPFCADCPFSLDLTRCIL